MSQIGVIVNSSETPPAVTNSNNTANAFAVGLADWGPGGSVQVSTPLTGLTQAAALIGAPNGGLVQSSRSATNATLYDAADAYFREGGGTLYVNRVLGPTPTRGSVALNDASAVAVATIRAAYYGVGSSSLNVAVASVGAGSIYTVTLTDTAGNTLAVSPNLTATANKTELVTWAATTNLITAASGTSACVPTGASAKALSAGTDDRTNASLAHWTTALTGLGSSLGPGQVMAPGQNPTSLAGIWSALASHAVNNNRVALLDGTDGNTATQAIAEVTSASIPSSEQSYCGIWAGNLQIPGVTSGTTRVIPPSPVVAALCARADNRGNPNTAAAGTQFPLQYVSGVNTVYSDPLSGDISTLNSNGINVFSTQFNVLQNFGFVSAQGVPTVDAIYWQLSHGRTRMAIIDAATGAAQPFEFSQIDGLGQVIASFGGAMASMLLRFYAVGALFGETANDAFTVDVGPSVNTVTALGNGTLSANLAVRMSPFAQLVSIVINAVPITQNLTQAAG